MAQNSKAARIGKRLDWDRDSSAPEWVKLIAKIVATPPFRKALQHRVLLEGVFNSQKELKTLDLCDLLDVDPGAVGSARDGLRKKLKAFADSVEGRAEEWLCEWPLEDQFLSFSLRGPAAECFWRPHKRRPASTTVICGERQMYSYCDSRLMFGNDTAFDEFDPATTQVLEVRDCGPDFHDQSWQGYAQDNLYRPLPLMSTVTEGEFLAANNLTSWLWQRGFGSATATLASRTTGQSLDSQVLLCSELSNPLVRQLENKLSFFFSGSGGYPMRAWGFTQEEEVRLERVGIKFERCRPGWPSEGPVQVSPPSFDHALGFVSRRDGTDGLMTIVSTQGFAMESFARALLDDSLVEEFLIQGGKTHRRPLPLTFDLLFLIGRRSSQLVCWRDEPIGQFQMDVAQARERMLKRMEMSDGDIPF